jgi:type IV secretion system protein VirB10
MSKHDSPNGLVVKPPPQQGFLGGGVSRKLIAVIGLSLFAVMTLILYIISQKGHHDTRTAEAPPVAEQSGSQDNGGLNDILGAAPDGTTVSAPQNESPAAHGSETASPDAAPAEYTRTGKHPNKAEYEDAKRARIARSQEAEQLHQRRIQLFQRKVTLLAKPLHWPIWNKSRRR